MNVTIYALCEPDTSEIRYVGKTCFPLEKRLREHLADARRLRNHRDKWIAALSRRGLKPLIVAIEQCSDDWAERERYWIAHHRALSDRLVNSTDGGEGGHGLKHSPARRERQREIARAVNTPEKRAAQSAQASARMTSERAQALNVPRWTPEAKAAQASKTAAMNAEPARKARQLLIIKAVNEQLRTPEGAEKRRAGWSDERRARQSEVGKRAMAKRWGTAPR